MFGSLGFPELLLIFVVALIVFGPRRLPDIGRSLGKALSEFKKATDELKNTIEREVRVDELRNIKPIDFSPSGETVTRDEPVKAIAAAPEPEQPITDPKPPTTDPEPSTTGPAPSGEPATPDAHTETTAHLPVVHVE